MPNPFIEADIKKKKKILQRKHNRFQHRSQRIGVWHGGKDGGYSKVGGCAARYLIPFSARLSKHRIRRLEHVRRAKTGYTRIGARRYKIISLLVTGHGDPPFVGWNTERVCLLCIYHCARDIYDALTHHLERIFFPGLVLAITCL